MCVKGDRAAVLGGISLDRQTRVKGKRKSEKEEGQPDSVLHYYRKLIALRKSGEYRELFTYGKFEPAYENADHVMAYYRILQGRRVLVAANFGTDTIELDWEVPAKKVLLSNKKRTNAENKLILEKCEVFVTECK